MSEKLNHYESLRLTAYTVSAGLMLLVANTTDQKWTLNGKRHDLYAANTPLRYKFYGRFLIPFSVGIAAPACVFGALYACTDPFVLLRRLFK
jgi:hypothetical protein